MTGLTALLVKHDGRDCTARQPISVAQARVSRRVFFMVSMMLVTFPSIGCTASSIDFSRMQSIRRDEGVAFGRLKVIYEGRDVENLTTIFGESKFTMFILPEGSSKALSAPLENDGYFFWHLPPGGYAIAGFEGNTPEIFSVRIKGRIFVNFRIAPNTVGYIGTLLLVLEKTRYAKRVEDEYEHAVARFRRAFPTIQTQITSSLMTLERER